MGKTCLITGGAGFIGSELTRLAAEAYDRVVVVDNLANGKRDNVAPLLSERVELHVEDIRNAAFMEHALRGVDVVFHLACLGVRHSIHSPTENHEVNAAATLQMLLAARQLGVGRFVYVSSSEVYGSLKPIVPMTEEHHTQPMTVYGASKLAGECYTRAFNRTYDYDTVVVRPFNAYGPRCHHEGDSGEVIPKFMLRCMAGRPMIVFGDGLQTRDFTFVTDTARGILAAGASPPAAGTTINLGHGREITIRELAEAVAQVVGVAPAIEYRDPRPGDVIRLMADTSVAKEILSFAPEVSLKDGLGRLHAWYGGQRHAPEELLADEVVENWLPKSA